MKKKLLVFLGCMMMLSGCRTNGRQVDATYDTSIYKDYMTLEERVDEINYYLTDDEKDLSLLGNLVDGLVETDKYGNLRAALAQDIGISSENYTIWEFSIRDGIPWVSAKGEETGYYVKADDFVCGIQYVLDHKNDSPYYDEIVSLIKNAKEYSEGTVSFSEVGVEAVGEYRVRYTLLESCSYFNTYLLNGGFYPVSRHILTEMGSDFATSPTRMWYNGAYYLEAFSDTHIFYRKNDHYWEVGQVSFDSGVITLVDDNYEALEMFKDGDLSYAYVDTNYAELHASSIDSHLYLSAKSPEVYAYVFNYGSKNKDLTLALQNENFRKAMLAGLNGAASYITQQETNEQEATQLNTAVQSTIVPAGFATTSSGSDYLSLGTLASISAKSNYNADKYTEYSANARLELNEQVTFPIEIAVPVCVDNDFELTEFNRAVERFEDTFVTFKVLQYSNEGSNSEIPSFNKVISENNYGMVLTSIDASSGDPSTYLSCLTENSSFNRKYMNFKNDQYNALFTAADVIQSSDARLMAFAECEAYIINKAFLIPFSHGQMTYKVSSINDYSLPSGTYGLSRFKLKGVKASESAITVSERAELKAAYEEAKNSL